jgi:hypothetical protein
MARSLTRREIMLAGALVAVAVGVSYFTGGDPPAGAGSGTPQGKTAATDVGAAPIVLLAHLSRETDGYNAQGRNLFQYYVPPPPPAPPPPTPPPTPEPTPFVAPPPEVMRPVVTEPARPRPPPIGFTYVGSLGPKDSRIAVLEVGSDMVLARAGDIVQTQFRLVGFGYESLVIGYTDPRFSGQTAELKQTQGTQTSRKR